MKARPAPAAPEPPDAADREAAVRARGVNVLVDAGAGTGKTTLLVRRVLELVAPRHGGRPVPLERIAAITFTRKAAGELKLRLREALLGALAEPEATGPRRGWLSGALSALDTAWVGTIHGFADRLLRLRPVEARLSPSYEIVEDEALLHAETYDLVMQAVDLGTLAEELDGLVPAGLAREAEEAVVDALRAGVRAESAEHAYGEYVGLDALFRRLVETRDVPPVVAEVPPPDLGRFRELAEEWRGLAGGIEGEAEGPRWLRRSVRVLDELTRLEDPAAILAGLERVRRSAPKRGVTRRETFADDPAAWAAWKAWLPDGNKKKVRERAMRDDLLAPFASWLARRLVRCAPVVVAAHERVKRRHRAVDQVDLLLKLRDLLRDHPAVRADLQGLFDQLLVDEFQDTDPLQAEIVLYLCEAGTSATTWREVSLAPGKLTVVGDPKQSIYRFRRADIEVYAGVRAIVRAGAPVEASLRANFRCAPRLIEWLNDRFDGILGRAADGASPFDAERGTVANVPLLAGRAGGDAPAVTVLPLDAPGGDDSVDAYRRTEARALATHLRALVDGRRELVDPVTGLARPVRFGDVAILTAATTRLPLLFSELDRLGIPYAVRGSRLFLEDPLHRQFLLALRRVADADDGVGEAALLRAPFFAVDLDDLARAKAAPPDSTLPGVLRVRAARALLADLRRRRASRPPGETARDLLERTGFARAVALGANGARRLASLRELCLRLDALAAEERLDFDGATRRMRAWVEEPIELDPPRPVGEEVVQILSIHQAKGLEYPVVVLWDACARLSARDQPSPFTVDRDGRAWALELEGLAWSEPADSGFAARELQYRNAERLRLVYVAATRARDLLVLPVTRPVDPADVNGRLAQDAPSRLVEPLAAFALDAPPAWAAGVSAPACPPPGDASALAADVEARWADALAVAARPLARPSSVTAEAHREPPRAEAEEDAGPRPVRRSRHGPVFGDTVHRAIGLALAEPALAPAGAVARAALATGLARLHAEAAADVARALAALELAGLRRAPGPDLRLEYPVAQVTEDGATLVQGYVDLVGARGGRLAVVDFKTDTPPEPGLDVTVSHPAYVAQVRAYARMLAELGVSADVEAALLFTADGGLRWV